MSQNKTPIKFEDIEPRLREAIAQKQKDDLIFPGEKSLTLVTGFISLPIDNIYDGNTRLGGRHIPAVAIVGSSSRLYVLALKVLLPDFDAELGNG